tara:strand:+ start:4374 stop:4487 length:114 start_codon:yes stop_codon:yes gene_type:complete
MITFLSAPLLAGAVLYNMYRSQERYLRKLKAQADKKK